MYTYIHKHSYTRAFLVICMHTYICSYFKDINKSYMSSNKHTQFQNVVFPKSGFTKNSRILHFLNFTTFGCSIILLVWESGNSGVMYAYMYIMNVYRQI